MRFIIFLAISAIVAYGTITLLKEGKDPSKGDNASLSVTIVHPQQGKMAETISATGVTIPREEIQVMTELSNVRVQDVLADVGDSVKKGQKLAILDGKSLVNQLTQLESDYERALDIFSRTNAMKNSGIVSKQAVVEKRTAMQAAKALRDNAKLDLERSTIIAPEDGVIFERNAIIGKLITTSDPLFRIARYSEIEMEATVPESVLSTLRANQPVSIILTGQNTPIEGKIRLITPKVDNTTRMAAIRIKLQTQNPLPVGLFANVRIIQSEHKGMLLPKTALQQDSAGDFIWVLDSKNKAERLPIKVSLLNDEQVMVDTLAPDIRIVARAGAFIKEGDHVHVVEDK